MSTIELKFMEAPIAPTGEKEGRVIYIYIYQNRAKLAFDPRSYNFLLSLLGLLLKSGPCLLNHIVFTRWLSLCITNYDK